MKQFIHVPTHIKTKRIMPGHGRSTRGTSAPIPGVDRVERRARRTGWTEKQAHRRHVYGMGGSLGLIGAMLALVLTLFAAMSPNANVLDRPSAEPTVELVDTAPAPSTDAVRTS
jgi:hypothetical protein